MLYSKFDVLAFAIASMAVALDISSLAVRKARSGAARNFEWGTKRRRSRGDVFPAKMFITRILKQKRTSRLCAFLAGRF